MATDVVMPRLSVTMKEGTVGKWYKKQGETIEKGEPLAEVVSEKATYDLESSRCFLCENALHSEKCDQYQQKSF